MAADSARIDREKATLAAMVQIYCRGHHILAVGHMVDGWKNKHRRKKQKGTP